MSTTVVEDESFAIRCLVCPNAQYSFSTTESRGRWAAQHTAETGHESWDVWDGELERIGPRSGMRESKVRRLLKEHEPVDVVDLLHTLASAPSELLERLEDCTADAAEWDRRR